MQAVILESIHLNPVIGFMNRSVVGENLTLQSVKIPDGTYTYISILIIHIDGKTFQGQMNFYQSTGLTNALKRMNGQSNFLDMM